MEYTSIFIHNIFIAFIALFPVVNPIGSAFIINPFFDDIDFETRKKAVKKIALYVFYICISVLLFGRWILELFGLSLFTIKIVGGIIIVKIGWDFLYQETKKINKNENKGNNNSLIFDKLFYPITFPITSGAGTISVLFTLSAHTYTKHILQSATIFLATIISIIAIVVLVYLSYLNAEYVVKKIGEENKNIINKFMGFLIICVGVEILSEGILDFILTNKI